MKPVLAFAAVVFVISTGMAGAAFADDVPGPEGSGVVVYSPKNWKTQKAKQGSEGILISVAPAEDAGLFYAVVEQKNLDAAIKAIDSVVAMAVKNVKLDKGGKTTVNGMPALAFSGVGIAADDQKPVALVAIVLQPNPTHVLFAIAMAHDDKKAAYKAEFEKALAGIRRK